jgi:hypothetical protein
MRLFSPGTKASPHAAVILEHVILYLHNLYTPYFTWSNEDTQIILKSENNADLNLHTFRGILLDWSGSEGDPHPR